MRDPRDMSRRPDVLAGGCATALAVDAVMSALGAAVLALVLGAFGHPVNFLAVWAFMFFAVVLFSRHGAS